MMKIRFKRFTRATLFCSALIVSNQAFSLGFNYDSFSFIESPVASHVGDTTIELLGLVDLAGDFAQEAEESSIVSMDLQIGLERQLQSSKTFGTIILGEYQSDLDDAFEATAEMYYGGIWGELSLGTVNKKAAELTERNTSAGKASLSFSGTSGSLSNLGLSYSGRMGPSQYAISVDDEGRLGIGGAFQRPIDDKDYRFAINMVSGDFDSDESNPEVDFEFDTTSINFLTELVYGSSIFDLALGVEKFDSDERSFNRNYLSLGVAHKVGALSFSAQVLKGDVDGFDQSSYALGAGYDLARGLSLNLGISRSNSDLDKSDLSIQSVETSKEMLSIRYQF